MPPVIHMGAGHHYGVTMAMGVGAGGYAAEVERLRSAYAAIPPGEPVRLAKRTSNLFRARSTADRPGLDVAAFDGVLAVDAEARTADVLGMTTYEHLVDATLPTASCPRSSRS